MYKTIVSIGLFTACTLLFVQPAASAGEEIRAAIDIGSGTTNMKIAKIDTDNNTIITMLFQKTLPVAYQSHLEKNGLFDQEVMQAGLKAMKILKEDADKYQVKKIVAVATAAFRSSKNAQVLVDEIMKQTGIEVKVISQEQEGILGFRAAVADASVRPEQAVVWDIGGGSFQLTTLDDAGNYVVEKGTEASVPFRNYIIQKIEGKDPKQVSTPNPMSRADMLKAIAYAETIAAGTNALIKQKICQSETCVLCIKAVGNLFNIGIRSLVNGKPQVTRSELNAAVMQLAEKGDAEIPGGAHADVYISNALLVLGFMNALNIQQVTVLDINNTDGVLTFPDYWKLPEEGVAQPKVKTVEAIPVLVN